MSRTASASAKQLCLALADTYASEPLEEMAELAAIVCQTSYAMAFVWHPIKGELRGAHGFSPFVYRVFARIAARGARAGHFHGKTNVDVLNHVPELNRSKLACYSGVPLMTGDNFLLGALWVFHEVDRAISVDQWRGLWLLSRQLATVVGSIDTQAKDSKSLGEDMVKVLDWGFHDLKSPLSTVALEVGALHARGHVSSGGVPRLARILSAVDRMHGIIHHLIDKTEGFSLRLVQRQIKKNQT